MFRSTSTLSGSQTYASCIKHVGRGSSPSRSADARLSSPGAARLSQPVRMPPPPPRAPPTTPTAARPPSALFGSAAPAYAGATPTRAAPVFGGRDAHASDEYGAEALFGAHAAHSPVAAPAAANAPSSRRVAAAPPHALSAQSGPCPTLALANGLKVLKEDVAHLREQHHEAVEAASKRHRELALAIEHERDDKRARTAPDASLAREVASLSARLSELAAALAAQSAHVAALQAELRAERASEPAEGDFFDLFFDGDDDENEPLDGVRGLEPLTDDGVDAPPPATDAAPCANGGLPPDEEDDVDGGFFAPTRELASQSDQRFAPIAPASPEAGGASAWPAVCRPAAVERRAPPPPLTPAAKPREDEIAPPDVGAYRLRSRAKGGVSASRGVRGSDSQSDGARRRLFDFDFAHGGGGYSVAEDLFDNAMSQ